MSAACSLLSEDQFLCSICLDVFTHPVTIPCGHNFCRSCISQHWSVNVQCQCPLCKEVCDRKPELRVNTFISEISAQFRRSAQRKSSCISERRFTGPDVPCDVCTETQLKAHKSCLVCLTSYCETHLEPHLRITGLKRHQLIDPRNNLEDRMCRKHDRPLEFFCRTDRTCVCRFCTESNHKQHRVVPLIEEYHQKKAELQKTGAEVQQLMEKKRLKVQQIRETVKLSRDDADRETTAGLQVFSALIRSAEEGLAQLVHTIQEKQKTREEQATGFIVELQEEISELMKRRSEVEQLSLTEDHLHLLRSSPSLNAAPPTKDWTEVRVHCSYEGTVRRAVARLEEALGEEVKKLTEAELKRLRRFAVDVTLDPDTAHAALILSEDGRRVRCGDVKTNVPDGPRRFSSSPRVLGRQSFSSGRFYYEVQVGGKTKWDLGVAGESVNRKGAVAARPPEGLWVVWLRRGREYKALDDPHVLLSLRSRPEKVGVFVDYEEGVVSFYDVDAAAEIYSFTGCRFSERLRPFFGPVSATRPTVLLSSSSRRSSAAWRDDALRGDWSNRGHFLFILPIADVMLPLPATCSRSSPGLCSNKDLTLHVFVPQSGFRDEFSFHGRRIF